MEFFWYYCCTYTGVPNFILIFFPILEERIISRFGSIVVEFFWYYCCTVTGMLFIIVNLFSLVLFSALSFSLNLFFTIVINTSILASYVFGILK